MKYRSKLLVSLTAGGVAALYAFVIRPWHLRWGATDAEVEMTLPCDELVEQPKFNATSVIVTKRLITVLPLYLVTLSVLACNRHLTIGAGAVRLNDNRCR